MIFIPMLSEFVFRFERRFSFDGFAVVVTAVKASFRFLHLEFDVDRWTKKIVNKKNVLGQLEIKNIKDFARSNNLVGKEKTWNREVVGSNPGAGY